MSNIYNSFFEDDNANMHFLYTGKSNIIGLSYPDMSLNNSKDAKYLQIGYITYETSETGEECYINEVLRVAARNSNGINVCNVSITGFGKSKRAVASSFKCVCSPLMDTSDPLKFYVTEYAYNDGEVAEYRLGIWLNVSGYKAIFVNQDSSNAISSVPINEEHLNSKYNIHLHTEDEIIMNETAFNVLDTIKANLVCESVSIHDKITDRISTLEARYVPDIQYSKVKYDSGFDPIYTGSAANSYQTISPSAVTIPDLGNTTPFITIQPSSNAFSVKEGKYFLQLITSMKQKDSVTTDTTKIEMRVLLNDNELSTMTLQYPAKMTTSIITSPFTVAKLSTSDLIRVQMKFLNDPIADLSNDNTHINILKLI